MLPHAIRILLAAVGPLLLDANAQQWEQIQPAVRPPAAIDAKMAFDGGRDVAKAITSWFWNMGFEK